MQLKKTKGKRDSRSNPPRIQEGGVALYVEGQTRRLISSLNLRAGLQTFLQLRNVDGYIAICPFFELTPTHIEILRSLRDSMEEALATPVQFVSGPRYLYALGKLFKEGPPHGIFIIITAMPSADVPVPGADYTFGDLQLAFAVTEFQTLEIVQRPTIRIDLGEGSEKGLKQFSDVAIQALAQFRGN